MSSNDKQSNPKFYSAAEQVYPTKTEWKVASHKMNADWKKATAKEQEKNKTGHSEGKGKQKGDRAATDHNIEPPIDEKRKGAEMSRNGADITQQKGNRERYDNIKAREFAKSRSKSLELKR